MIIQWFPGHMVKARRLITESIKLVDAVCEVIDARIPLSSRNPDMDELTAGKPRLIILNRIDLADRNATKKWAAYFKNSGAGVLETDCKSGKGVDKLSQAVLTLLADKRETYIASGQSGRALRLVVAGIPNVGKSSLINRAAKRKAAQTADTPGVTRGKQWINLGNGIELLDTPGVLWHKFEDRTVAENLAFTGAVRDAVMDIETLGARLTARLARSYPQCLVNRYKIDIDTDTVSRNPEDEDNDEYGFELLSRAAAKRGFLLPGRELDLERMAVTILDEFRGGVLGTITLETVDS